MLCDINNITINKNDRFDIDVDTVNKKCRAIICQIARPSGDNNKQNEETQVSQSCIYFINALFVFIYRFVKAIMFRRRV